MSNEEVVPPIQSNRDSLAKETKKGEREPVSSNSSEAGSPTDHDVEKGTPVKTLDVDDPPEPTNPNVVDWEGPDDPQNPQNW